MHLSLGREGIKETADNYLYIYTRRIIFQVEKLSLSNSKLSKKEKKTKARAWRRKNRRGEGGQKERNKEREERRRRRKKEMVEACAAEYFHTEVNNTSRYPGQGWPTTPLPPEIFSFWRGGKLLVFFLIKLEIT